MIVDQSEFTAIVPVRKGSRRLPNKNLAPFSGNTLLQHKINQLKTFLPLSNILVSSDSDEMLGVAHQNGVCAHDRPSLYSDDVEGKPLGDTIALIAEQVQTKHILWAQVTSPLVDADLYESAVGTYLEGIGTDFDSLISVQRVRDYLRDENGPLNYDIAKGHLPSQMLPELWRVTYGIVMAPREQMLAWRYYYGPKPYLLEVNKYQAMDIDDGEDLLISEAVYERLRNP